MAVTHFSGAIRGWIFGEPREEQRLKCKAGGSLQEPEQVIVLVTGCP